MYIEGADENLLQLEGSHSEPVIQGSRRINLHISGMLVYNIAHYDGIQITLRELSIVHIQGLALSLQRTLMAKYNYN